MASKEFIARNGIIANGAFVANSTQFSLSIVVGNTTAIAVGANVIANATTVIAPQLAAGANVIANTTVIISPKFASGANVLANNTHMVSPVFFISSSVLANTTGMYSPLFQAGANVWANTTYLVCPNFAMGGGTITISNTQISIGANVVANTTTVRATTLSSVDLFGDTGIHCGSNVNVNTSSLLVGNSTVFCFLPTTGSPQFTGTPLAASYNTTSDERLKDKHYVYATSANLLDLKPWVYSWKTDTAKVPHIGLMAQDVQYLVPLAVKENEQGGLAIDYNALFAAFINTVATRFDRMQFEIDELRRKIDG